MTEWVTQLVDKLGYPAIALLMFLENVFPPIPSELIMPLAGFMSAEGDLSFFGVVVAGTFGSVVGSLPLYFLGKLVGQERLTAWVDRYGKWLAMSGKDIKRATEWLDRHGDIAVAICRLVPGVRSLISIPAGIADMPLVRFLLYTAVGATLWTALLAFAGRMLGKNYERVSTYVGPVSYVVLGAILVAGVVWVARRSRQRSGSGATSSS